MVVAFTSQFCAVRCVWRCITSYVGVVDVVMMGVM